MGWQRLRGSHLQSAARLPGTTIYPSSGVTGEEPELSRGVSLKAILYFMDRGNL